MNASIGSEIIKSYKRLSYTAWYALAELIDNSTQSYYNHKDALDKLFIKKNQSLSIDIFTKNTANGKSLVIKDKSMGMNEHDLGNALAFGIPTSYSKGRSKYGLGLKTSACWLGNYWTIHTSKLGEAIEHSIEFDVEKVSEDSKDLNHKQIKADLDSHYTIIEISQLNIKFAPRTISKVKTYLASMYRHDFKNINLDLNVFGYKLEWDYKTQIFNDLIIDPDGNPLKREFSYCLDKNNEISINGWCGVFEKGGRIKAGFSLIQSDRVIQDWNPGYRPFLIFKDASNDLVNQRLVGELFLSNFDVSHTKDKILFSDDQEEKLEKYLYEEFIEFIRIAKDHRKKIATNSIEKYLYSNNAVKIIEKEIKSSLFYDSINIKETPPYQLIKDVNSTIFNDIIEKSSPKFDIKMGTTNVILYVVNDRSPNDPYLIIELHKDKNTVTIVVNQEHRHWDSLVSEDSILNFLRHCVYDGVAEWKAMNILSDIHPETIKSIKDDLLKIPFELKESI